MVDEPKWSTQRTERPTPKQASAVYTALDAIHACLHVAATDFETEEGREWDDLLEERYQELCEGRDQREVVRAIFGAAVSIAANYEGLTGLDHRTLIVGVQEAIMDYQNGLN